MPIDIKTALQKLKEINDNRPSFEHTGSPGYISKSGMRGLQEAYDRVHKQEVAELNGLIKALSRMGPKMFSAERV
jgi:hypothetical protein